MVVFEFINVHLVHKSHYAKRLGAVRSGWRSYFMNIMNSCEVVFCMALGKITGYQWKGL